MKQRYANGSTCLLRIARGFVVKVCGPDYLIAGWRARFEEAGAFAQQFGFGQFFDSL